MSLRERALSIAEKGKNKILENRAIEKLVFTFNMGFNSRYRDRWLTDHLSRDLSQGLVTPEQSQQILDQSKKPQTSRHFGEAFAIPVISYLFAGTSSAYIAYYAWETNDPFAWGYTMSHFAQGIPKVSISSAVRAVLLAASIGLDHIQDREVGSKKRVAGEMASIAVSAVSWVGSGNAGPAMRMGLSSPDLGNYLRKKALGVKRPTEIVSLPDYRKESIPLYYKTLTA